MARTNCSQWRRLVAPVILAVAFGAAAPVFAQPQTPAQRQAAAAARAQAAAAAAAQAKAQAARAQSQGQAARAQSQNQSQAQAQAQAAATRAQSQAQASRSAAQAQAAAARANAQAQIQMARATARAAEATARAVRQPPWIVMHLGLILGLGIPLLIFGLGIIGAIIKKGRAMPVTARARKRLGELRPQILAVSNGIRAEMDAAQRRALASFSSQVYSEVSAAILSAQTRGRAQLESIRQESHLLYQQLRQLEEELTADAADNVADAANDAVSDLDNYADGLKEILRDRLEAQVAVQQAGGAVDAGQRRQCPTCGAPIDPGNATGRCNYCGGGL